MSSDSLRQLSAVTMYVNFVIGGMCGGSDGRGAYDIRRRELHGEAIREYMKQNRTSEADARRKIQQLLDDGWNYRLRY